MKDCARVKIIEDGIVLHITQETVNEWAQEWVNHCSHKIKLTDTIDQALGDMEQIE